MSIYYCAKCDEPKNNDTNVCTDVGGELWCEGCCSSLPEDWEDYKITFWKKPIPDRNNDFEAVHKDYDGAPIHSFGPPADNRFFTGPSRADIIEQIEEYNEERL